MPKKPYNIICPTCGKRLDSTGPHNTEREIARFCRDCGKVFWVKVTLKDGKYEFTSREGK